jgi:hypothetical protein
MQLHFPVLFPAFEIEMQNSGQTDNGACAQRIRASFHFVKFASEGGNLFGPGQPHDAPQYPLHFPDRTVVKFAQIRSLVTRFPAHCSRRCVIQY